MLVIEHHKCQIHNCCAQTNEHHQSHNYCSINMLTIKNQITILACLIFYGPVGCKCHGARR